MLLRSPLFLFRHQKPYNKPRIITANEKNVFPVAQGKTTNDLILYVLHRSSEKTEKEKGLKATVSFLNENINHLNKAHLSVSRFMPCSSPSAPLYRGFACVAAAVCIIFQIMIFSSRSYFCCSTQKKCKLPSVPLSNRVES